MSKIERQFSETEKTLERVLELAGQPPDGLEARADEISGWSVALQLDHLALAGRVIFRGLSKRLEEGVEGPRDRVNFPGRVVLLLGWIPRGKGRAPQGTQPDPSSQELERHLDEMKESFDALSPNLGELTDQEVWMPHPYFGGFDALQWLRFTEVHNRHHLKIVAEILAKAGQG